MIDNLAVKFAVVDFGVIGVRAVAVRKTKAIRGFLNLAPRCKLVVH